MSINSSSTASVLDLQTLLQFSNKVFDHMAHMYMATVAIYRQESVTLNNNQSRSVLFLLTDECDELY